MSNPEAVPLIHACAAKELSMMSSLSMHKAIQECPLSKPSLILSITACFHSLKSNHYAPFYQSSLAYLSVRHAVYCHATAKTVHGWSAQHDKLHSLITELLQDCLLSEPSTKCIVLAQVWSLQFLLSKQLGLTFLHASVVSICTLGVVRHLPLAPTQSTCIMWQVLVTS